MPRRMASVVQWTYRGPVDAESRLFGISRSDVIKAVFAGDDWCDIVQWGGVVNEPLHASQDIAADVTGQRVEITVERERDLVLVGGLYRPSGGGGRTAIVLLSGSGGPPEKYCQALVKAYLRPPLRPEVAAVLVVDYRGFGCSRHATQKQPGPDYVPKAPYMPGSKALYTDAAAAIAFLRTQGFAEGNIVLHGYSLGSGPATEMALRMPGLAGLILHGPMADVYTNAKHGLGGGVLGVLGGLVAHGNVGFENIKKIDRVRVPICILCGPNDEVMWPQAQRLLDKARKARRDVVLVEHAGDHLDTGAALGGSRDVFGGGFQHTKVNPAEGVRQFLVACGRARHRLVG